MREYKIMIDRIPAIVYGEASENCYLFIHGKQGFKEEAESFARIAVPKGWQVLSIDLPEHGERKMEKDRFNPWFVVPELKMVLQYMRQHWTVAALRANSIGAWFAMQSFCGLEFVKCLFVSPVLDMEKLIQNMMQWAAVSEERLEAESLIPTDFGETLSWDYYKYAKAHPVAEWQCRTDILYAEHDQMTSRDTVTDFAERFHASLTVMKDGEHWFHTPEQVDVMNKWTEACVQVLGKN